MVDIVKEMCSMTNEEVEVQACALLHLSHNEKPPLGIKCDESDLFLL